MREIKFRAWHKAKKRMSQVSDMCWYDAVEPDGAVGEIFVKGCFTPSYFFPTEVEIMQFTGLRDKNGTEIYEGDIVLGFDAALPEPDAMKIVWRNDPFAGWYMSDKEDLRPHLMTPPHGIVIGNIHENPELLK